MRAKKEKEEKERRERIKEKFREAREHLLELEKWKWLIKKDELYEILRRIRTAEGVCEYWRNRAKGLSHFRSQIECYEYWEANK